MKDIKFRAWDNTDQKMLKNVGFHPHIAEHHEDGSFTLTPSIDRWILMQFTGLLDKNGKECYEDDLIEIHGSTFHVIWNGPPNGAGFYLGLYKGSAVTALQMYRVPDGEIVGNVYEN